MSWRMPSSVDDRLHQQVCDAMMTISKALYAERVPPSPLAPPPPCPNQYRRFFVFGVSRVVRLCVEGVRLHVRVSVAAGHSGDNPGGNDSFFCQLPYKCCLDEVKSVGD